MDHEMKKLFYIVAYFVTLILISVSMSFFPNNYMALIIFISITIGGLLLTLIKMNKFKPKWDPKLDRIKKELKTYKISLMILFYSTIFGFNLVEFTEIMKAIFSLVEALICIIISLLPMIFYVYAGIKLHRQLKRTLKEKIKMDFYWVIMFQLVIFIPYGFAALSQSYEFFFLSITITIICITLCGIGLFKSYIPEISD